LYPARRVKERETQGLGFHFDVGCSVLDVRCSHFNTRGTSNIQHRTLNIEVRKAENEDGARAGDNPRAVSFSASEANR
jgi:hypothetical protein